MESHPLKMISGKVYRGLAVIVLIVNFSIPMNAHAITLLPDADCPNNCLIFDDVTVYSLAFLNFLVGEGVPGPGDPFYVKSTGSAISDAVVVASSPGGRRNNQDVIPGTGDNAYDTPNSVSDPRGFTDFLMTGTDPAAAFVGDNVRSGDAVFWNYPGMNGTMPLWDIEVSSLQSYLNGEDLVFYFNLNESNKGGLGDGQDLGVYADVYLTDTDANTNIKFTISGNITSPLPGQSLDQLGTNSTDLLPLQDDKWAHVHGEICVSPTAGLVFLGSCAEATAASVFVPGNAQTVNQNLGANTAAFAVYNQQLSDLVTAPGSIYDILTVDLRMTYIDNGYDQLFILPTTFNETGLPEPGTVLLFGIGLAGLMGFRKIHS